MSELMDFLEQFQIHCYELFRILSEIVHQFLELGRHLIRIVEERRVFDELADRAFAVLYRINESVEFRYAIPDVVVERLVFRESAQCAFAAVDPVGDVLKLRGQIVDSMVERGIIYELADGAAAALDFHNKEIHAIADLHTLSVQLVIGYQPAHSAGSGASVAHEGVKFFRRTVGVVVNRGIGEKFTEGALTAFDTVGDFLEIFAEHLEIGDDVVGALNDSSNISLFAALY